MMTKPKLIFLATLAASTLLLAGCVVAPKLNTNTNVATANMNTVIASDWLTYINTEYGFSLKYPSDWTAEVLKEGGLGTDAGDIAIHDNALCSVLITVPHKKDSEAKAADMYNTALNSGSYGVEPVKKVFLGSIQAIQYIDPKFAYGRKGEIYKFLLNGKVFSTTLSYGHGNESCQSNLDQIISTMSVDTSNWQTYTDNTYNFTFQYPSGWKINIEKTESKSWLIPDSSIYVIQLLLNDEIMLSILPEGQLDHDLEPNMKSSTLTVDNKSVNLRYSDTYQVYSFDKYPKENSEFRTESHATNVTDQTSIKNIITSIHFNP